MKLFTIFRNGFEKTQRAQGTQGKKQLVVHFVSYVVNLLYPNPSTRKELKSHEAMKG